MKADQSHLTDAQRDYFTAVGRIAPEPDMERHVQAAIRPLGANRPAPVKRSFLRGLRRGFLLGRPWFR